MKYFATTFLVAGVTAQTFDAASTVDALITTTNSLKTQVDAYVGGDPTQLQAAAKNIVDQIVKDDVQVKAITALTQDQALAIAGPVQKLFARYADTLKGAAAKSAVDAIVAKKQTFVSAGQGSAVYSALAAQASASNQFSTDLTSKVPQALQPIAANLAAPISSALASGVSAYQDVATASGSASSSSAASVASSSATTTATATAVATTSAIATASSDVTAATSMATATGTGAPIVTGAAGSVVAAGSGVLGLAFIAALAL